MIVCICRRLSDRTIDHHIAQGADSPEALARACGAGTDCGSCIGLLAGLCQSPSGEPSSGECGRQLLALDAA